MTVSTIIHEVSEARQVANELLPARDFTRPGDAPMSLDDAAHKIAMEYSEALGILGKI
ncbi:hypothetical protein [Saccharothrix deserti]|uniref:hypothetical protein n=1 Tax=Saccharothrix deserti TaxID=2593674 RepID=UPI00131C5E41|nr:hypothetical protein [Saccharothrix deserti]